MNNVYFACRECRVFVDAGYRWACSVLEDAGVIARGRRISAEAVLGAAEYWSGPEVDEAAWLRDEVLPQVKRFLESHGRHQIEYGDKEELFRECKEYLDWLELGLDPTPTLRWFVEVKHFKDWSEVEAWVDGHREPWWWEPEALDEARTRFNALIAQTAG